MQLEAILYQLILGIWTDTKQNIQHSQWTILSNISLMFHLNACFNSFNIILLPNAEPENQYLWKLSLKYTAERSNTIL